MPSKFNISAKLKAFEELKKTLPVKLGASSVNFFKQSFRGSQAGFIDQGLQKWKEVKRRTPGTKAYKYAKKSSRTRGILVKSGELRNSIAVKSTSFERTLIATDKKYAQVHNEGLKAGRGKGFTMPKRKFMGDSHELTKKHLKTIKKDIDSAMK